MKIFLSPQFNFDSDKIEYSFDNNIITATYKGITDTFDLNALPLGHIATNLESAFGFTPVLNAKHDEEGLHVTLLNYINDESSEEEKFPVWKEV